MSDNLLQVDHLRASFFTHVGEVQAVRDGSFSLKKGEILGLVGESGSGKSVTCMSVMKLLSHPGRITGGAVHFRGRDLVPLGEREMQQVRGNEISMGFQDPMTSLNPVYTVGSQMVEVIRQHRPLDRRQAKEAAIKMLSLVGIPSPEERFHNYPHEFSGGMRQRALIAMALSCDPGLLIADEPTTALDVTIQAQVLELIGEVRERLGTSIILITHDLGVIAESCERVIVMYGGMIMEQAPVEKIFFDPRNPYTLGLLQSVPDPTKETRERLQPIPGSPPDLLNPPRGCPFSGRCRFAMHICEQRLPPLYEVEEGHQSRCWLLDEAAPRVPEIRKEGAKG